MREEIGDLLFAATNIARHMQVEPEAALKFTNRKFRQRFEYIENALHDRGQAFDQTSIDEDWKSCGRKRKKIGPTAITDPILTFIVRCNYLIVDPNGSQDRSERFFEVAFVLRRNGNHVEQLAVA